VTPPDRRGRAPLPGPAFGTLPMDDPHLPAPGDDAPEIADASSLFRDAPAARPGPPPPSAVGPTSDDSYALVHPPEPEAAEPPTPAAAPARPRPTSARGEKDRASAAALRPKRDPHEAVQQVWSRSAEWGGTLLLLAAAGTGVIFLTYLLLSFEQYGLAFLAFLFGSLALVVLSYPILITLERPVRITPEQAVRDFYAALSHHVPHYRRMWLLLSHEGRVSGSFASFEGFRGYWKSRLDEFRRGRASGLTPLKFQVEDFESDKSAGREEVGARYTVKAFLRGRQSEGPVWSVRVTTTLVKGPDKMWYLDRGTLP
jgi:hypothetical protein